MGGQRGEAALEPSAAVGCPAAAAREALRERRAFLADGRLRYIDTMPRFHHPIQSQLQNP